MRLLYLDASGDPGAPPPWGKSTTRYYVLGGLAVVPEKYFDALKGIKQIVDKYFIEKIEDKKKFPKELKYTDIHGKKKPFNLLSEEERTSLIDDVFSLIRTLKPTLFAIYVNKPKHFETYKYPEKPNILAMRYIIPRFSKYLQRINDVGSIVYDAEERNINKDFRNLIARGREIGLVKLPYYYPFYTQNHAERIVETIFFVESDRSPLIQLADFIAKAVYLKYERGQEKRFNEIYDLFDRDDNGILYGIREAP